MGDIVVESLGGQVALHGAVHHASYETVRTVVVAALP
jgi:hypothetical protein